MQMPRIFRNSNAPKIYFPHLFKNRASTLRLCPTHAPRRSNEPFSSEQSGKLLGRHPHDPLNLERLCRSPRHAADHSPRFRALALLGRLPSARADGDANQASEKPCMGRFLSRGCRKGPIHSFVPQFFCSTWAARFFVPTHEIDLGPARAGAVKDGAQRHPEGLSLMAPSTTAHLSVSG
jgi:hypothetical protein